MNSSAISRRAPQILNLPTLLPQILIDAMAIVFAPSKEVPSGMMMMMMKLDGL